MKLPHAIRFGLSLALAASAVTVIIAMIFIQRRVIDYRPTTDISLADRRFFPFALSLADPIPAEGNAIKLLQNGNEIFPAMLAAIRGAKTNVNFEAFLVYSGKVATDFIDALCERARNGVKVRVLLDGVGSSVELKNSDVERLKMAGCEFAYFHPTRAWRVDRLNVRTHRRILVVDGKLGFTGSVGFADSWEGNGQSRDEWRDEQLQVEGPLVAKLQAAFFQHWAQETGKPLGDVGDFPELAPMGNIRAQTVSSHAFSLAPLAWLEAVAFSSAKKTIFITNAYCSPSQSQVEQLVAAAKRGVDVRILLPGDRDNHPVAKASGRQAYGELLRGGVRISEYQPTMIHSKSLVIDGLLSVVGSSNFDARSAQINEELDVAIYDKEFASQMEAVFSDDQRKTKPYTLEDFSGRSIWERVDEWLVLPFRSQI
jgi:cardiolipin synthase A/B